MAIGLELTDDEMRRVMECRERWRDDQAIELAAGICIRAMVESWPIKRLFWLRSLGTMPGYRPGLILEAVA